MNDGSAAERLIQSMKQFEKDIRNAEDKKEDEKEDEKTELDLIKRHHVVRTRTAGARGGTSSETTLLFEMDGHDLL